MARNRSLTMSLAISGTLLVGCPITLNAPNLTKVTGVEGGVHVAINTTPPPPALTPAASASPDASPSVEATASPSPNSGLTQDDIDRLAHAFASALPTAAPTATPTVTPEPTPVPTPPPTPIPAAWKELTGTFRFTGLVNGKAAQILGGAFDYTKNRPVFWVKSDAGGGSTTEGAFVLQDASPSLAAAHFEPAPEITGPFDQKTFFGKLNGKPSIVSSFDQDTGLVNFWPEYSQKLSSVIIPPVWFGGQQIKTEEDLSGLLLVGRLWIVLILPNFNPAQIWHVATPSEQFTYTDDVKSFGSTTVYGFHSPTDGHDFFFTKRGDAYAEEETSITPW